MTMEKSEFDIQAETFLAKNNLAITITYLDNHPPRWDSDNYDHNRYRVTLRRKDADKARFVFFFWDSLANSNKGVKPSAYDVLAAISSELTLYDSFADFCGEFGYDQDSIKASQIWKAYDRQSRKLNDFLTETEKQELEEIR
jgi:hypothetical protein